MATELNRLNVGNAGYGNNQLVLSYDLNSRSIDGNYTTITLYLYLTCPVRISFASAQAWLHNSGWFNIPTSFSAGDHLLKQMTINIPHNADGTGAFNVGFGVNTTFVVSGSGTGGTTLPTIPRATTPTLTYDDSQKRLGSVLTINTPRASNSFTHTVKYDIGSASGTIATDVTTSTKWTMPLSLANQFTESETGIGNIIVETYNGSTKIGTKSIQFTTKVADNMLPSFTSVTATRVDNGVPSSFGVYVESISKVKLAINGAVGSYGSTIKAYSISGGGLSTDKASDTLGPINSNGTITFTATITDSRGRTASKTVSITVYPYNAPTFTLVASRCNSAGTETPTGTYIAITPTYSVASVNSKNAVASKRFEIVGTSYVNTAAASGTKFVLGAGAIALDSQYTVKGKITDSLGKPAEIEVIVKVASAIANAKQNGKGFAFGVYATKDNTLESAWLIDATAGIKSKGYDAIYFTTTESWS